MASRLLEVRDLKTYFYTGYGVVRAVDGVTFHIDKGETLGIVGESGCGKSVTSLSVMRLVPDPPGKIVDGHILFEGRDLLSISEGEMRRVRGNAVSMIFQEPMTALNPVYTVGDQIAEAIRLHQGLTPRNAMEKAVDVLRMVGIPLPEKRAYEYPHQLSGGMRQRVVIGIALSCRPQLLIADEPTTALDVTVQSQILELLKRLKKELGMTIMLITHDLGVVAEMAQRVMIMYAGKTVEEGDAASLFRRPLHPYTEGLLKSIPRVDVDKSRLDVIPGTVPDPLNIPKGCRFGPRCPYCTDICRAREPEYVQVAPGRRVACWLRTGEQATRGIAS